MMSIQLFHLRAEFLTHITREKEEKELEHALSRAQQLLRASVDDQRLQPVCFVARKSLAARRKPEIPPPFIAFALFGGCLFDEAVGEHAPQRSIEIAGKDPFTGQPFLDSAYEAPAMLGLRAEREKDLEYQRLERSGHLVSI